MNALLLWTCGLLLVTGLHGLSDFPEHFVVANEDDPVTLTCRTQSVGDVGDVVWKFHGQTPAAAAAVEVTLGVNVRLDGVDLTVSRVDKDMLGEYSCWRGGAMISSTYLLMEDVEEDEEIDSLHCRAKSYHCQFGCDWTLNAGRMAVRIGLGSNCSENRKSCRWVSGGVGGVGGDGGDGGVGGVDSRRVHVELPHHLQPYAEESDLLQVSAQALTSDLYILRANRSFYLRDIVRPDSPEVCVCEQQAGVNVTVSAPSSWSTPHSFFSLQHQLELTHRDDGRTEKRRLDSWVVLPRGISRLRARCRDSLVQSQWSEWSGWKNVTQ